MLSTSQLVVLCSTRVLSSKWTCTDTEYNWNPSSIHSKDEFESVSRNRYERCRYDCCAIPYIRAVNPLTTGGATFQQSYIPWLIISLSKSAAKSSSDSSSSDSSLSLPKSSKASSLSFFFVAATGCCLTGC